MAGSNSPTDALPPSVMIGAHAVGPGRRVLIIAEAGVNHDGRAEDARALVDAAAGAGADFVKFQVFRAADLTTRTADLAAYQRSSAGPTSQQAMLQQLELDDAAFATLATQCARRGVGFLATPFGVDDVARLVRLHVPALKIASTDIDNTPLLHAAALTRLPLIVSTGTATAGEIAACISDLAAWGAAQRTILLHCVSSYPTPVAAANLRRVGALAMRYGLPVGFSDHTTSVAIAGWAVAAGACVLEKHLTLDRTRPGPDHAVSLEPAEFAAYVAAAREAEAALGIGTLNAADLEADVRRVARKSIVARRDIPAGAVLSADALTVKRPGGGLSPRQLAEIVGRRTRVAIAADTMLAWDMLA